MRALRARGASRAELALLALLALWGLVPILVLGIHALTAHERLTGADGIVGSDQLQYMAWARDAGDHILASNLFNLAPSAHVFAQPLFTVSGILWRLGVPIQAAYLLWKPVAIAVLFAGAAAWVRRMFPGRARAQVAALCLSLFLLTPIASLTEWVSIGSQHFRDNLSQLGAEMLPAGELWGYLPSAIAIGLTPVALLAAERALQRQPVGGGALRPTLIAAVAALLVSWLHPWQGVTLVLIVIGMAVWDRGRGLRIHAVVLSAGALPLVYYLLLSRLDSAWMIAARNELVPRLPFGALLAGLGPLVLVAAAGVRRPGADPIERALLLWIPAALLSYLLIDSFPSHAWEGVSLPFAVLSVRAGMRLKPPPAIAALAIAAVTIPGLVYDARTFRNVSRSPNQQYYLSSSDARALDWIARRAPRGGVLASPLFAVGVPSQTGRAVWVGHEFWSPDYPARFRVAGALFDGRLQPAQTRLVVALTGARLVMSDCSHRTDLEPALRPILVSVHRFGCATVYVVRGASEATGALRLPSRLAAASRSRLDSKRQVAYAVIAM